MNTRISSYSPLFTQAAITPSATAVSVSAASRTATALPGGAIAIEDTFVRRSVIQPHASAACATPALAPQAAPMTAATPATAGKKRKKKGFGKKLGNALKRAGKTVGKGLGQLAKASIKLATLPFKFTQRALELAWSAPQLLTGGPRR